MVYTKTAKLYNVSKALYKVNNFLPVSCTRWKTDNYFCRKSVNSVFNSNVFVVNSCQSKLCYSSLRHYSTQGSDKANEQTRLPTLMEFPEIIWPSVIKTIRNWVLANLIIRPYFDNEFNLPDFVAGSKQALQTISSKLAGEDINELEGLVASDTLAQLRRTISSMSVSQRQQLAVVKEDIYFSFPYQIGVIFDESSNSSQRRWVEITMCFHTLKGLKDMMEQGHNPPLNMGMLPEYTEKISICNYRFLREFTKGVESQWVVNVVNHFKPNALNKV